MNELVVADRVSEWNRVGIHLTPVATMGCGRCRRSPASGTRSGDRYGLITPRPAARTRNCCRCRRAAA